MSRFSDYEGDGDDSFNGNGPYMWEKRAELALRGRRGRKALAELREALLAMPAPRLVESVMCVPNAEVPGGHDVCIIGAHVWYQKVKSGLDPVAAFEAVPRIKAGDDEFDFNDAGNETALVGRDHGLTFTLAWELAHQNDEDFGGYTPEDRWAAFIEFIDRELARPPLTRPPKRVKKPRVSRAAIAAAAKSAPSLELGL